jgi:pimeloyl-ACP methyl ester carboxylesterase
MAAVPPATYRAAMRVLVGFDRRAWLPAITVPTLVLAGEQDGNAPPAVMQRMAEKIAGARYVELPGAGHLANMEQPDAFNDALRHFLSKHFPTSANPRR